jgi:hypothetical protein
MAGHFMEAVDTVAVDVEGGGRKVPKTTLIELAGGTSALS